MAAVWVSSIVTVGGIVTSALVRSAPGEPVPAAGGASVAVSVKVAPVGTT